ncbi:MAG: hypothetical protein AB1510_04130 [Bacillota bacterium]
MGNEENMPDVLDFKDRRAGLIVFGIFEILFGAFFALMIPLMLIGMLASAVVNSGSAPSVNMGMIVGELYYGAHKSGQAEKNLTRIKNLWAALQC